MEIKTVYLAKGKEVSLKRFHPWLFSGALRKNQILPEEGDLVRVLGHEGDFMALGHFQKSSIALRILSFSDEKIDDEWWRQKIAAAWNLRLHLGLADSRNTDVFRIIHGEGDGLPGLIVDFYAGTAVMQAHSAGMYYARDTILSALCEVLGKRLKAVYDKSSQTLPFKAGIAVRDGIIYGKPTEGIVTENGYKFRIDWESGQKTGFFTDQRESRKLLEEYCRGRNVLNLFSYTGGFSVYALGAGAALVDTVDSSEKAISLAIENARLNFGEDKRHNAFCDDVFTFLTNRSRRYDVMVVDPPAFAKHQDALANALQGYKKLNRMAIAAVSPGGIVFTFSCSQAVSRENFRKSVFAASANTGRNVRILHQLSQPADHPVSMYHPEGEYLKGLVLVVD
jgi:23S rRNA (cytosine1962-C5)-methyltransferase